MIKVYLKPSAFTDSYGGFPNIVSFGGEWDGSDVGGRNPDWLIGMRASYNGKIYEALTNHDGDVNSPPDTNTTDWREVTGAMDDPYKATDLIGSNFLLDSLTDDHEVILTDGSYEYMTFSSTVYPKNGKPTFRALNDHKAIISDNSFAPSNIICVGLDVLYPRVSGYTSFPDSGGIGFHYERCILSNTNYWWPPANCVVKHSLIKVSLSGRGMFYGAYGQRTNQLHTDKAIHVEGCTLVIESPAETSGDYILSSLINQGLMNPVFKDNIFYIRSNHSSTKLNIDYNGTWENNVFFDVTDQVVSNTHNIENINPDFINPTGSSFTDFQLRPSSRLIGGYEKSNSLLSKHPSGVWVDHNHTPVQASYSYNLDSGDGENYSFSGDATGSDPELTVNTRDTLTFTNNTGGHPLAIYNSLNIEVSIESGGTTTFTPKYPDTYYYQCTAPGHENMRGDIVVTLGALGSYEHPFESYHDAIDSGYYNSKMTLLFKEGDHLMSWYPGTNYMTNPGISSSFPGGLSFVGEDPETTRFTTGNNFNAYCAFYVNVSYPGSAQSQTPLTIEGMGFHINNTSSYLNRGLFSGAHWKSFTLKRSKVTCDLGGAINSSLFDYFGSVAPAGYEINLSGCEMNVPLSGNNGPGGSFLTGNTDIKYTVNSCTFTKLDGYNYVASGPSPIMVGGVFSSSNGSKIKDCIFYSNAGGNFRSSSVIASGVFSSCIFYSATDSFTNLPPDMDVNSAADPLFIDTLAGSEDLRLRPGSSAIGGISKHPSASTSIWYVDLIGGDDANNGKTPDTAMLTISAAHAASIHLDTIFIVNENISVSSDLDFPGGRKYESLTKCTIDFNDNYSSSISAAAGLDTYIKGFDFIKMRGGSSLLSISSDVNSLFVIEGCKFEGILTNNQSAPIGGNGASSRSARQGSIIKGCSFDIGWSTLTSGGSTSCGFIAVDKTDIVACTFWVKDSTPLGSTNLYLVGTGGVGAWSHGPPLGPVEVKNCIVHGNNRMHYGMGGAGTGGNLGFTSNARVTVNSANYVIHNCCLYGINGTPMEIDNSISNNRYNNGSIVNDRSIPLEWIENIFTEDPKLVDPGGGNFALKADSPLIGQGK